MSDTPKLYAERRPMELEPHYSAHMLAMTVEDLRGKSEIAEELAFRDKSITKLERENAALRAELERVRKDAERYRWLRDLSLARKKMSVYVGQTFYSGDVACNRFLHGKEMDAAIDAAIAQGRGGK